MYTSLKYWFVYSRYTLKYNFCVAASTGPSERMNNKRDENNLTFTFVNPNLSLYVSFNYFTTLIHFIRVSMYAECTKFIVVKLNTFYVFIYHIYIYMYIKTNITINTTQQVLITLRSAIL